MAKWANPHDLVGETLEGRFRLVRLLGEGGMGAVYEARHLRLESRVAVKVLASQLAADERQRKRFLREARAAVRIQHDNVVQIMDFGEEPIAYFVMEYLEGVDLSELVRMSGRLPWSRVRELCLPAIRALGAAHQVGIIHRDVKPSNVFLLKRDDGTDHVKVLDFGIAKVTDSGPETRGVTRTDEVLGTVAYMSPEQALAYPIDARTDVYSMGVLLFELLTGQVPYNGSTQYQIIHQHIHAPPPSLRAIEPRIPPEVEAIVIRALQKRPDERYQTMDELRAALEAVPGTALGNLADRPASPPGSTVPIAVPGDALFGAPSHELVDEPSERGAARDPTAQRMRGHPMSDTQQEILSASPGPGRSTGSSNASKSTAWVVLGLGFCLVAGAGAWLAMRSPGAGDPGAEGSVVEQTAASTDPHGRITTEQPAQPERDAPTKASPASDLELPITRPAIPQGPAVLELPTDAEPSNAPSPAPSDPTAAGREGSADVEGDAPVAPPPSSTKTSRATSRERETKRPAKPREPAKESAAQAPSKKTASNESAAPEPVNNDRALLNRIASGSKQCGLRTPTTLSFQVMQSGAVLLVQTSPSNGCVESLVREQKFGPRARPESKRLQLKP